MVVHVFMRVCVHVRACETNVREFVCFSVSIRCWTMNQYANIVYTVYVYIVKVMYLLMLWHRYCDTFSNCIVLYCKVSDTVSPIATIYLQMGDIVRC